jgi:hypothetical protein
MKVLIIQDTFAPSLDGPSHLPANTLADLEADSAHAVVRATKGLYVDQKDDPTRGKQFTASDARLSAAREAAAAAKAAAKSAAKAPAPTE